MYIARVPHYMIVRDSQILRFQNPMKLLNQLSTVTLAWTLLFHNCAMQSACTVQLYAENIKVDQQNTVTSRCTRAGKHGTCLLCIRPRFSAASAALMLATAVDNAVRLFHRPFLATAAGDTAALF